jgi:hypothetical protein
VWENGNRQQSCLFSRGTICYFRLLQGSGVKQGGVRMTIATRLSVVTAYVAFAFVGAIVLGMIQL